MGFWYRHDLAQAGETLMLMLKLLLALFLALPAAPPSSQTQQQPSPIQGR